MSTLGREPSFIGPLFPTPVTEIIVDFLVNLFK